LNLPPSRDILNHFGLYAENDVKIKRALARVLFFYDTLNDFVVHGELSTMAIGEKALLMKGLPEVKAANDILILDRGFGHFCTMVELLNRGKNFCVRLPLCSKMAKRIMEGKRKDFVVKWEPSNKEKENCRKNGLACNPITIRLVKVTLKNGEIELLATNLIDQNIYTGKDMKDLYRYRWGIEEGFKKIKPKMKIEQFGCRKAEGIYQEFYAHIFCINMISLAGSMANFLIQEKTKDRKKQYKYNWQNAYRFLREKTTQLIMGRNTHEIIDLLIDQIASSVIPISPGRKFARDMRHKSKQRRINQFHK
jgi:hypothetical protein